MSESGEDFGGFGTSTPNRPKAVAASAKPSSSRAQAGPSRTAAGGGGAAARRKAAAVEDSDVEDQPPPAKKTKATARGRKQQEREQEVEEDEGVYPVGDAEMEDEDIEEIDPPRPKTKGRPVSKKPASQSTSALNGNATLASAAVKGKGKAKAKPTPKAREPSVEEMDLEVLDAPEEPIDVEDEEEEEAVIKPGRTAARGTKIAKLPTRPSANQDREIARLKEQLSQAETHITDLNRQLQELLQVRNTEPEQLLERIESQHQAQIRAQDDLIEDLKAKLAKNDPLLRSGKKAVFELLTREEANKEMEKLHNQLKSYKEALYERDQSLKDKDEQIQALQTEKTDLQYELKAEIERSKTLLSKAQRQPMGSVSRTNGALVPSHQDPKLGEVIKFYEDLSNILVPSIKVQPGRYLNTDESLLTCCYTYKDVTDKEAIPKSIYFSLRLCHDLRSGASEPVVSMDQLVESVHYIPRELDKESPDFVASLGFLSDTFTFERDQLSLFLRTLYEVLSGEGNDSNSKSGREDASDDGSVELVQ